jgi:L-fuculose-phosphate aldolase
MDSRSALTDAIVEACRRVHARGWVANHDGNVSARWQDSLLATPTAVSKADVTAEMVLVLDMEGKKLQGTGKPFSEIRLHLAAYRARPDIQAVLHAHPPLATAKGLAGGDFKVRLPEAVVSIGDSIPVVPYALPGDPESETQLAAALGQVDLLMMAGNGVLSVGRDVKEAYLRMELLEHLLLIEYYARAMGPWLPLPAEDRAKLLERRAALGLGPKGAAPASPGAGAAAPALPPHAVELIQKLVAEELAKLMSDKG